MMKKFSIVIVGFGTIFLMGCQKIETLPTPVEQLTGTSETTGLIETGILQENTGISIQSFQDCLEAGFPIMESYPRQCNDGITTYTEIITQDLSGQQTPEKEDIIEPKLEETGTNLSILQQKLRAMMERRNQQIQSWTTNSWTSTNTNPVVTTTANSGNEQVTEQDIENLEKIIDEIIKK